MQRLTFVLLAVITLTVTCAYDSSTEDTPRVLLFIRDGSMDLEYMLEHEAGVMKASLEQAGFDVDVATATGGPLSAGTVSFEPDLKVADARAGQYAGMIIPCMAAEDVPGSEINAEAVALANQLAAEGKPVAAQFGGVRILAKAGVLKGKKFASHAEWDLNDHPYFAESIHSGQGVVVDGKIITSGVCPYMAREQEIQDGTEELVEALVEAMESSAL